MGAPPHSAQSASSVFVSIPNGTASGGVGPGYSPSAITIVIGVNNTVTWTNNDDTAHTVTPSETPSPGSWSFGSGNMNPGEVYSFTFTVPGNYTYTCAYHSFMFASITVKSSGSPAPEFSQAR